MVPDARAKGGETMRCLGYLKCVIAYLNGMLNHPLPERPRDLPYYLGRFAQITETTLSDSGELLTHTRNVSIDYAIKQRIKCAFNRSDSDLPPPIINFPVDPTR